MNTIYCMTAYVYSHGHEKSISVVMHMCIQLLIYSYDMKVMIAHEMCAKISYSVQHEKCMKIATYMSEI